MDLMRWPWRRFEAMWVRHQARRGKEALERQRDLLIAAINANSNYDGEDAQEAKSDRIRAIEEATTEGIELIYARLHGIEVPQAESDAYETDPLFAPLRKRRKAQEDAEHAAAVRQHAALVAEIDRNAGNYAQQVRAPELDQAGMGRNMLDAMVIG